ncbi:unnamed protein product [Ascophyllum nodosum]
MEEDSEHWKAAALQRIEEVKAVHRQQRTRLEANMESNPLQGCYSAHLVGLEHREEEALAKREEEPSAALSSRIEKMLADETKTFSKVQARHNLDRWRALLDRQRSARQRLARQMRDEMARHREAYETPTQCCAEGGVGVRSQHEQRFCRPPVDRDFDARERDMRAASTENWAKNESFNLKSAFDLQLRRIEAEWAEHEAKIWADYDARRAALEAPPGGAIEGRFKHSPPRRSTVAAALGSNGGGRDFGHGNGGVSGHEASWHTREKQSRLIHTAPVFHPRSRRSSAAESPDLRNVTGNRGLVGTVTGLLGRSGSTIGGRWAKAAAKELERLDKTFFALKNDLRVQKIMAQKCIRRQRIRMEAQIEATWEEKKQRQVLLAAAEREEDELSAMVAASTRSVVGASTVSGGPAVDANGDE